MLIMRATILDTCRLITYNAKLYPLNTSMQVKKIFIAANRIKNIQSQCNYVSDILQAYKNV